MIFSSEFSDFCCKIGENFQELVKISGSVLVLDSDAGGGGGGGGGDEDDGDAGGEACGVV